MSAHFVSCFAFDEQIISFNRCAVNRCDVEKTRGQEYKSQKYHRGCSQELARLEEGRHIDALRSFGCMVFQLLDDGQTQEEVKAWVSAAVRGN